MGRLIVVIFFLVLLTAIGLVAYAYLGPMFGADFSPPSGEVRVPVQLDAD